MTVYELGEKDPTIQRVIERLAGRFGRGAFAIVDHWDGDLCAIGIARPDDHGTLAYICTFGEPENCYYVELELPPPADSDMPNRSVSIRSTGFRTLTITTKPGSS